MRTKELITTIKRHRSTIDVLKTEIEKIKKEFLAKQLKAMGLKEGDIVEVEDERSGFNLPTEKVWTKGYIKRLRIDWDGDVNFSLGTLKKDGTPSGIGTILYSVDLTGKFKTKVRKVK